jgi:hypothetical protein
MKLFIPIIAIALLCFVACEPYSKPSTQPVDISQLPPTPETHLPADPADRVLYSGTAEMMLSGINNKEDLLSIEVKGENWQTATILFTIANSDEQEIWREKLSGNDFVGSYDEDLSTPEKINQHIEKRIKAFFDEKNWKKPAVASNATFEADHCPDKHLWETLKASGANGFSYTLGKEDKRYIAYSPQAQKMQLYYQCC